MAIKHDSLLEPGIVNAYVCAALDAPGNGLKEIELQDPSVAGGAVPQAVSLVPRELTPMRRASNTHFDMSKELLLVVRTPGDELFGVVNVAAELLEPSPTVGKMVTRLAQHDGDPAQVIGEIHEGEEGSIIVEYPPSYEREPGVDPEWVVSIGMAPGEQGREIAIGHIGVGVTTVYRADPTSEVQFSELPLEPRVWSGLSGPTLHAFNS
jgi:hypothetical protein